MYNYFLYIYLFQLEVYAFHYATSIYISANYFAYAYIITNKIYESQKPHPLSRIITVISLLCVKHAETYICVTFLELDVIMMPNTL
jgi:hypothetical protein